MSLHKILLFGAFWVAIAAPINAYADWKLVSRNSTDDATYIDMSTLRKTGPTVKVWILYDFKSPQLPVGHSQPLFSMQTQYELDCFNESVRTLWVTSYSENMGRGKVLVSGDPNGKSMPIPPRSVMSSVFNSACRQGK